MKLGGIFRAFQVFQTYKDFFPGDLKIWEKVYNVIIRSLGGKLKNITPFSIPSSAQSSING